MNHKQLGVGVFWTGPFLTQSQPKQSPCCQARGTTGGVWHYFEAGAQMSVDFGMTCKILQCCKPYSPYWEMWSLNPFSRHLTTTSGASVWNSASASRDVPCPPSACNQLTLITLGNNKDKKPKLLLKEMTFCLLVWNRRHWCCEGSIISECSRSRQTWRAVFPTPADLALH